MVVITWEPLTESKELSQGAEKLIGESWKLESRFFHYSMDWRRWLRNCKSNPGLLSTTFAVNQAIWVFGRSV